MIWEHSNISEKRTILNKVAKLVKKKKKRFSASSLTYWTYRSRSVQ